MAIREYSLNLLRVITDPVAEMLMRLFNGPYHVEIRPYLDSKSSRDDGASDDYVEYFEDAIEGFREKFALWTVVYSVLVVILLGSLYIINIYGNINISLQITGFSIDILGATILARGLLSGPITIAHRSTSGYGGGNSELRDSMIQDAIDGTWGVFLLLVGFLIQAYAIF